MKNLFEELANSVDAKTDALTFIKKAFAGIFEQETGIDLSKEIKPSAYTDNNLDFDGFSDMLGFLHFHAQAQKIMDELGEGEAPDFDEIRILGEKSHAKIVNMRKAFDVSILTVVSAIIKALGHETQVIEISNPEEFVRQMEELKEEEDNA